MKHIKFYKINILIILLAVSAGLIFFTCGFLSLVPKNVTVNGVDIGGKRRAEAAEIIRQSITGQLKQKSLTVYGGQNKYVFTYPEINFTDNLQSILSGAKKGESYTADIKYYLNGASEISANICADESRPVIEPYALFQTEGEPFEYFEGQDGLKADRVKLLSDIRKSLGGDFNDVYVSVKTVTRTVPQSEVQYNTRLLRSFTTYFDGSNTDRAHNIRLAASMINGTVLENGQGFSFNQTVGQRTSERGFKPAKIIEHGEFVEGIGGGVCQVSTTLYNAALLCGCDITEYHPHSLAVSYVPPSFDAMVSGNYYDLKFENRTGYTLYIRAKTTANSITFSIYGRGDGAQYDYMSRVTGSIQAPEETTSDMSLVRDGKDGTISEGYLTVTRGCIKKTVLLRRDKYSPVKRLVPDTSLTEENGEEVGEQIDN